MTLPLPPRPTPQRDPYNPSTREVCRDCWGTGLASTSTLSRACPACHGRGYVDR
jgi:DnaJ-class molecular chaperone